MNASSTLRILSALGCAVALSACGSAPPAEPPPFPPIPPPPTEGAESSDPMADDMMADDEPEEAKPAAPAKATWGAMNHAQKADYMKTAVMPKMAAEFKAFDAKHFNKMNCMSCHGPTASKGKFEMPNAALNKLPKDGNFAKLPKKMTTFMKAKVVPEMATLLDVKPYDPATKQGFGCFGCHTPGK